MVSVTAHRSALRAQLTAIVETMAKSVLSQLCKVVDEDTVELHLELSRLLVVNSTLADKVNSLESELTNVRKSDQLQFGQSQRSVGVQTGSTTDGHPCGKSCPQTNFKKSRNSPDFYCLRSHFSVSTSPTIAGIFGKDWCMNLWKDGDPYSQDSVPESLQSSYKVRRSLPIKVLTSIV
ncbi:unnamed protein product [Tetraodon nigroviridis]|uniref:(spotted green pufferfish) hypothetical protein n=1 Tax=Tetraodon nigroviridis TaxID=99883 RepID=Q4RHG6_TETNG|nr:unnamed protein product [Tetraodon nigroviridis]